MKQSQMMGFNRSKEMITIICYGTFEKKSSSKVLIKKSFVEKKKHKQGTFCGRVHKRTARVKQSI